MTEAYLFNMKPSPSSSERALTSLRLDLPLNRHGAGGSGGSVGPGSTAPSTLDSFLVHLGDPGRFQIVVMILLASNCIPVVVNHLLMAFYAVPAPHNCRVRRITIRNARFVSTHVYCRLL